MDGCGHATAGFTKANELFVGRVAMIGFAASLVGEYFQNGKGPLGQLGTSSEHPCSTKCYTDLLCSHAHVHFKFKHTSSVWFRKLW